MNVRCLASSDKVCRVWIQRQGVTALLVVALGLGTMQAAVAGPDGATDRVTRFLQDQGLLQQGGAAQNSNVDPPSAAAPGLMEQVRNRASDLVLTAMNFLGVPYRRGGTSEESGFDCSGFTRHVFENSIGMLLPRRSQDQAKSGDLLTVRKEDLKPGDLVFFNTMRHAFSHVGIYIGDDKFIHSPRTGGEVRVEDMRESYWIKRFNGARRAPTLGAVATSGNAKAATNVAP